MISCEKAKLETIENGKKVSIEGYDVELEDTILFPEGGGQVCLQNVYSVLITSKLCFAPVLFLLIPNYTNCCRIPLVWSTPDDSKRRHASKSKHIFTHFLILLLSLQAAYCVQEIIYELVFSFFMPVSLETELRHKTRFTCIQFANLNILKVHISV